MSRVRPDRASSSGRSVADRPIPDRDQTQTHDRGTPFADPATEPSPGMTVDPDAVSGSDAPGSAAPDANARQGNAGEQRPAAPPTFSTAHDQSHIDEHSSFDGKFHTAHDLVVNGAMEGEIGCEGQLVVAEGARIKAQVTAANITVAGELEGEITCTGLLDILPSGRL